MTQRKRKPLGALLLLATLLGACATPYIPPTEGPTARLVVRGEDLVLGSQLHIFEDARNCTGIKTITDGSLKKKVDSVTTIRAGQPATLRTSFYLHSYPYSISCAYIVTFDPKENHKYLAQIGSNNQSCGVLIFDVTSGEWVLEPSARKRDKTELITGGLCNPETSTPVKPKDNSPSLNDFRDLLGDE